MIFPSPYTPEWNPIEPCWSKLKEFLPARAASTRDTLEAAVADAMGTITALFLYMHASVAPRPRAVIMRGTKESVQHTAASVNAGAPPIAAATAHPPDSGQEPKRRMRGDRSLTFRVAAP
jgi:hypothetical protein